jgi:hypothetical protein
MATIKIKPVEPVKPSVILELSGNEVEALRYVLLRVGGSPDTTRRKHTDAISRALTEAGIEIPSFARSEVVANGSIFFKE